MGCCSGRCFLITICILQLITTIERQVFDFLGFMWAPIIGNFVHIIFLIIGFFGAIQYRPKVTILYVVWCLIWLGCNIFVICFYLEVGILTRDKPWLSIVDDNKSWWYENGIGCTVNDSTSSPNNSNSQPAESDDITVTGCLIEYYYVEIIQAGVQCLLALLGFCIGCYVIYVFTEEDDSLDLDNPTQPVHDELEYIKMRYKCPAQSSFRDVNHKTYQTVDSPSPLTQQHPHHHHQRGNGGRRSSGGRGGYPQMGTQRSVDSAVKQTEIPGWENDYDHSPGNTHGSRQDTSLYGEDLNPPQYPPHTQQHYGYQQQQHPQQQQQRTYNIIGQTQGVTVI